MLAPDHPQAKRQKSMPAVECAPDDDAADASDLDLDIEIELGMHEELQAAAQAETPEAALRAVRRQSYNSFVPSVVTGGPAWQHVVVPDAV